MSENTRFSGTFDKQHGKRVQALFKSASQYVDHIYW